MQTENELIEVKVEEKPPLKFVFNEKKFRKILKEIAIESDELEERGLGKFTVEIDEDEMKEALLKVEKGEMTFTEFHKIDMETERDFINCIRLDNISLYWLYSKISGLKEMTQKIKIIRKQNLFINFDENRKHKNNYVVVVKGKDLKRINAILLRKLKK